MPFAISGVVLIILNCRAKQLNCAFKILYPTTARNVFFVPFTWKPDDHLCFTITYNCALLYILNRLIKPERISYITTLQILDAVIVGRILLYFIAHALELFCVFRYDIAELYWFCMDFYCAVF
jgi:hypothetical protein